MSKNEEIIKGKYYLLSALSELWEEKPVKQSMLQNPFL